jgi:hypothetical protein
VAHTQKERIARRYVMMKQNLTEALKKLMMERQWVGGRQTGSKSVLKGGSKTSGMSLCKKLAPMRYG